MWYGIPWSFLVVGDEGYLVPSRKLLCLCQPPENYAPNGMALFHTCLTVGLIQLFISFYYLKISMGIHLLVAHHLHPLSQIFCSKWMKERIIEKNDFSQEFHQRVSGSRIWQQRNCSNNFCFFFFFFRVASFNFDPTTNKVKDER